MVSRLRAPLVANALHDSVGDEGRPNMDRHKFATAITCIDGRIQTPVSDWLKHQLEVDYVDVITEPGADRVLVQGPLDGFDAMKRIESIKRSAALSVEAHGSRAIAVVGHHDCAANAVPKEEHLGQIRKCVQVVVAWELPVRVLGLWVNDQWAVELVADTQRTSA